MDRRLALKREHLSDLTAGDLATVAGAGGPLSIEVCIVFPTRAANCAELSLSCLTGYYPSINASCSNAC
jgi:hypothetical protein